MPNKQILGMVSILIVVAAACGGTASAPAPPTALPTGVPVATPEPFPTPTVEELPATQPGPNAVAEIAGRPSAPAPPDEYRADPASLVGATGNPQLIEFFTYW